MVDRQGGLHPLRITSAEFVELASTLDESLPRTEEGVPRFYVWLGNLGDYCGNLDSLRKFLTRVGDKVVRQFSLSVWGLVLPKAEPPEARYLQIVVECWPWGANYKIRNARSDIEAEGLAASISKFRHRHAASPFLNPAVGYYLGIALVFAALFDGFVAWTCSSPPFAGIVPAGLSYFWTRFLLLHALYILCTFAVVGYIAWSHVTKTPPPLSFQHSILYMDREPKNNLFWAVILGFLFSIIAGVVAGLLPH